MTAQASVESAAASGQRIIAGRLGPGVDLFEGLRALCNRHNVHQGFVTSMIGSLSVMTVVSAERQPDGTIIYGEPQRVEKTLELIAGQGTLGQDNGRLSIHLHGLAGDGCHFYGGHLVEGHPNIVLATAEICITALDSPTIEKHDDTETGFRVFRVGLPGF